MWKFLHMQILRILPKIFLTRIIGFLARLHLPKFLLKIWIWVFAKIYKIRQDEIAQQEFFCFNDFFGRQLKSECRPIAESPHEIISPVDGRIGAIGNIENQTLFQAKGLFYSLADLVASPEYTTLFNQGNYITIYLSPRHYHRIHSPVDGIVQELSYIPGGLYPVHNFAVHNIVGLFAHNERIITILQHAIIGAVAVIKIGATIVGKIKVTYDTIESKHIQSSIHRHYSDKIYLAKGQELGRFEMGSTVILLFPPQKIKFLDLPLGHELQYGQTIGKIIT